MISDADTVVIGAGAVGLACAAALAKAGRDVIVLEAAHAIGTGISSRNSEVIHAGLYYPTGSLRHRLCVEGRRKLCAWMEARGVAHRKTGKLIVATSAGETGKIEALYQQGCANDVEGLSLLSGAEARALEPELQCVAALLSSETGIFDSHAFMLTVRGALEDQGGLIAFNAPVIAADVRGDGRFDLHVGGSEPMTLTAARIVNCAGLNAVRFAKMLTGFDDAHVPKMTLAKGSYFKCLTRAPFKHLIYPVPADGGLGVHVTLDLGGQMRFGPDVEWLGHDDPDAVDYRVDVRRADQFYAAVRTYWPGLPDGAITADYAGCRPKLSAPGEAAVDFRIDGPSVHGQAGLVHLFGIESPGLTSALAIADEVVRVLLD